MPPKDTISEKAIIGCCLILGEIPFGIDLKPNNFYNDLNARIWTAIIYLNEGQVMLDIISLHKQLVRNHVTVLSTYLVACIEKAWPEEDPDGELLTYEEYALRYQVVIRNAAYQRNRKILKERIVNLIIRNEFPSAYRALQTLIGAGYD
jgi:hypothetical protein